jgi:hypothetical protein
MHVKNASGTILRTYTCSPTDTLAVMPFNYDTQSLYIAGQPFTARTIIFEFENNYGNTNYMGVRDVEFFDENDEVINLTWDNCEAYATSMLSWNYRPLYMFLSDRAVANSWYNQSWLSDSYQITNQRVVLTFTSSRTIKTMRVSNSHDYGSSTSILTGARNVRIYYTDVAYTSTVYGDSLGTFHKIFDGAFEKHVQSNTADFKDIVLESEGLNVDAGEATSLKYVGPKNQDSTYDGALFYTLERVPSGYSPYYTYERDDETGEYKTDSNGNLVTDREVGYYGNLIKKWRINNSTFTLDFVASYSRMSDSDDWFSAQTFGIQTYEAELLDHVPSGTGLLYFTTTSGLSKYDTILVGPSSDTDNVGAVEEVYIHSIDYDTNAVVVRSYGSVAPTIYEYVEGDPVTVLKYAHLISSPRPLQNSSNIRYGYDPAGGTLHTLDLNSYCSVVGAQYGGVFTNVTATAWNPNYEVVSFVKGCNLIHYDLEQQRPTKSQFLMNMYDDDTEPEIVDVYDIAFNGTDIYRLQQAELTWDSSGIATLTEYSDYNYVVDTLEIYSNNITVYASDAVVGYQGATTVTAVVRDQFGVGLVGKSVSFSVENDSLGVLDPSDGNTTTDADGTCSVQYTASADFEGITKIVARASGANSGFGSVYVTGHVDITAVPNNLASAGLLDVSSEFTNGVPLTSVASSIDGSLSILCFVRRSVPGGEWEWKGVWADTDDPTIEDRNQLKSSSESTMAFLQTVYQPTFSSLQTDEAGQLINDSALRMPRARITQGSSDGELKLLTKKEATDVRNLSQNYLSRHLSAGNVVTANLNQFAFTQEAIPNFWSERNTPTIAYWIRLRPYAYSLDGATLKILVYEISWAGTSTTVDIAPLGTITTFDAGSGLEGIDFSYNFPEDFHNNATVYVEVQVYDHAPTPNFITMSYWFKIIPDFNRPYIENRIPLAEAYDVGVDTEISFDVLDKGDGVDITTLEVFVNNRQVSYSYVEYEPGQFHIKCNTHKVFTYGQEVSVSVFVRDLSDNENLLRDSWIFYCVESVGPWFDVDDVSPAKCARGLERDLDEISVQVYGINDTGVDYDSLRLDIGGKRRDIKVTPIVYRLR